MGGFDAGQAVETLAWDFRPYIEADGVIPEPKQAEVNAFFGAIRETVVASGAEVGATPEAIISGLAGLPQDVVEEHSEKLFEALVEFCQGSPNREQIQALPVRPMQAFMGWLTGQLLDPGKGDMQRSLVQANGAAPHM